MKSKRLFPIKKNFIYLNHCGISPLYSGAVKAAISFIKCHNRYGMNVAEVYNDLLVRFHQAAGKLLQTQEENISFMKNTAEAMSMISQSFPFQEGDEIISFCHEYPSNHYPWILTASRKVKLILLGNVQPKHFPKESNVCGWSMEELEEKITPRTRMISLSHVQFTSGFTADLKRLSHLCKSYKNQRIFLIIDAAQSLGSLPLFPEAMGIDAIAASGWKWLMGPIGSGILYTSPSLRSHLGFFMAGPELMKQGDDYLNLKWLPHQDGRRFEYSTSSYELVAQLLSCIEEIFLPIGIENIYREIQSLQEVFLEHIDLKRYRHLNFSEENSSGIMSFVVDSDPTEIVQQAKKQGVFLSSRAGYLRVAPHFYNTQEEIIQSSKILNSLQI